VCLVPQGAGVRLASTRKSEAQSTRHDSTSNARSRCLGIAHSHRSTPTSHTPRMYSPTHRVHPICPLTTAHTQLSFMKSCHERAPQRKYLMEYVPSRKCRYARPTSVHICVRHVRSCMRDRCPSRHSLCSMRRSDDTTTPPVPPGAVEALCAAPAAVGGRAAARLG